ncbi:MAG: cobalamin-dependent protein, partial [Treponema sp.]|nr:cobalamin-dependent protein [Treponema sp.]
MSNIVLATINAKWIHPSLALRLLKANLGALQTSCQILEFALRQPLSEKIEPILAARPRLLGFSVAIWNHKATLELLEILSSKWASLDLPAEKPLVVLGGSEVSLLPNDAEIFRYADYIIRGEGEERFRLLCSRVFAGEGGVVVDRSFVNGECASAAVADVNTIASAYHLYTDEDLHKKHVYVESSRDCAFGCEYCQESTKQGQTRGVREFPMEPFLAEMGTLIDRGAQKFKFLDRSFNFNVKRAVQIMEFFLERIASRRIKDANEAPPFCVLFEMLPFRFPPELREVIRRFPPGSLRLEIGIQTFNP